jgi:hypothetical protein
MNFFNNIITPLKDWILKWNGKQQLHLWNHIFQVKELFHFIIKYKFSTKTYQHKIKHDYNDQIYPMKSIKSFIHQYMILYIYIYIKSLKQYGNDILDT